MDRKDFFKKACGMGICSCMGLSLLSRCKITALETDDKSTEEKKDPTETTDVPADARQIQNLLIYVESSVDEPAKTNIFKQLGAEHLTIPEYAAYIKECQKNLKGYFDRVNSGNDKYWEKIEYNPESSTIKVTGKPVVKCVCAYAQHENPPLSLCKICCSNYQKIFFEMLLDKPVTKVQIDEAYLLGGKRCSTTIYIDGTLKIEKT